MNSLGLSRTRAALLAFVAISFARPMAVWAHGFNPILLQLEEAPNGLTRVLWRTPPIPDGNKPPHPTPELPSHCRQAGETFETVDGLGKATRWTIDCGAAGLFGAEIKVRGLEAGDPELLVRIGLRDGQSRIRALRYGDASLVIPASSTPWRTVRDYTRLGVAHILSGYDHLSFVLGLLLLVRSGRRLAFATTAFTVAHSITLSLATLGWVHVPTAAGEAIIALSIVFLAAELVRPAGAPVTITARYPWVVALGFGLIHGFGFAGALAEVGLPVSDVPLALFGFNVGVELGQLFCVAIALATGVLLRRIAPRVTARGFKPLAYAMGAIATFWFVQRIVEMMA